MTQQQFDELKSLISRNFEMIGRVYEEHGGRLTRLEVVQEQFGDDLRAVAEGVTGNAERLDRLEGRFDRFEDRFDHLEGRFDGTEGRFDHLEGRFDGLDTKLDHLSASVGVSSTDHEVRLRALEN